MSSAGPIVITGATGFIGRHLVESLEADGLRVRAIVRRPGLFSLRTESIVAADIHDREAIRRALEGASSIVHLAGRAHAKPEGSSDPGSECTRINVGGTALLLEEAAAAGIRTFVFASSVKAVADESRTALTPDTPPRPQDAYGESKLEAERLVRVVAARDGIYAPILRLPVVYGPRMKANMAALFGAVDRGIPLPLASVKNRRSFVYVGNATAAIRALLEPRAPGSPTGYVSDEKDMSTPDLIREIARVLGRPPRLVPMPQVMLRALGTTGGLLSRIAGLHFSTGSVTAVLGSLFVDTSSLREMTGSIPPFSAEQGMSLTAEWFRANHRS